MPFADWMDFLTSTVQVETLVSRNADNEPVYGTPKPYKCRISYSLRSTPSLGTPGSQIASRGSIWLPIESGVNEGSRITLPSGEMLSVLAIEAPFDVTGEAHHIKATFR